MVLAWRYYYTPWLHFILYSQFIRSFQNSYTHVSRVCASVWQVWLYSTESVSGVTICLVSKKKKNSLYCSFSRLRVCDLVAVLSEILLKCSLLNLRNSRASISSTARLITVDTLKIVSRFTIAVSPASWTFFFFPRSSAASHSIFVQRKALISAQKCSPRWRQCSYSKSEQSERPKSELARFRQHSE